VARDLPARPWQLAGSKLLRTSEALGHLLALPDEVDAVGTPRRGVSADPSRRPTPPPSGWSQAPSHQRPSARRDAGQPPPASSDPRHALSRRAVRREAARARRCGRRPVWRPTPLPQPHSVQRCPGHGTSHTGLCRSTATSKPACLQWPVGASSGGQRLAAPVARPNTSRFQHSPPIPRPRRRAP
jgi:hypothetical protein